MIFDFEVLGFVFCDFVWECCWVVLVLEDVFKVDVLWVVLILIFFDVVKCGGIFDCLKLLEELKFYGLKLVGECWYLEVRCVFVEVFGEVLVVINVCVGDV